MNFLDEKVQKMGYPENLLCVLLDKKVELEQIHKRLVAASKLEVIELVESALDNMTESESEALHRYFSAGKTFKRIGEEMNMSREKARQTIAKAVKKLQHPARLAVFLEFFLPSTTLNLTEIWVEAPAVLTKILAEDEKGNMTDLTAQIVENSSVYRDEIVMSLQEIGDKVKAITKFNMLYVISDVGLRGEIYRLGNYGDKIWQKYAVTQGYA